MQEIQDVVELDIQKLYDKKVAKQISDYLESEKLHSQKHLTDQHGYARTSWMGTTPKFNRNYNQTGEITEFTKNHSICHGFISRSLNKNCRIIINTLSNCLTPSKARFIDFISGEDGPWKAVTKHLFVLRDKDNHDCPYATILIDPNPVFSQTYVNYLIGTRMASCWSADIQWEALVNQGLSKHTALILSQYMQLYDPDNPGHNKIDNVFRNPSEVIFSAYAIEKGKFFKGSDTNETPFHVEKGEAWNWPGKYVSPKYILDGTPQDSKTFADGGTSSVQCNWIWDRTNLQPFKYTDSNFNKLVDIVTGKKKLTKKDCSRIENTLYDEKEAVVL